MKIGVMVKLFDKGGLSPPKLEAVNVSNEERIN